MDPHNQADTATTNLPGSEQEQSPAEKSAGFAAGFNRVRTGEAQVVVEPAVIEQPQETPAPSPEVTPPPKLFAGLTEEQLVDKLARVDVLEQTLTNRFREVGGQFGRLKQMIDGIQASTPQGELVELTAEDLADLKAEYPDLAGLVAKDLNAVLKKVGTRGTGGTLQYDQEAVQAVINEQVGYVAQNLQQQFDQRMAITVLDLKHPDRMEVQKTPEFAEWLRVKGEEFANNMQFSWDTDFVANGLSEFKDWRSKKTASTRRIEDAVTPTKGTTPTTAIPPSSSQSFAKGFNRVLQK